MRKLIRITSLYFVAGIITDDGKVTEVAPIIGYMRGWQIDRVINYCDKKGWDYKVIQ